MKMQPQERNATDAQTLWAIDPTHSTVEFAVKKLFFFTVKGSLTKLEGSLVLDPVDVRRSSAAVVLQSASIDTGNKQTRQATACRGFSRCRSLSGNSF